MPASSNAAASAAPFVFTPMASVANLPVVGNGTLGSLNGLKGNLSLAQGTNITITEAGNVLTVGAPNTLTAVVHDQTLTGSGTLASPLGAVQSEALIEPVASRTDVIFNESQGLNTADLFLVPAGKRLVIEHVSADCNIPTGQRISSFYIAIGAYPRSNYN